MDDDLGPLRESARSPSQEKCASKCVRGIVLSAFIYFLARNGIGVSTTCDSGWLILGRQCVLVTVNRPLPQAVLTRIQFACVAEQQKHPPPKSGGLDCPSWVRVLPHAPNLFLGM